MVRVQRSQKSLKEAYKRASLITCIGFGIDPPLPPPPPPQKKKKKISIFQGV